MNKTVIVRWSVNDCPEDFAERIIAMAKRCRKTLEVQSETYASRCDGCFKFEIVPNDHSTERPRFIDVIL